MAKVKQQLFEDDSPIERVPTNRQYTGIKKPFPYESYKGTISMTIPDDSMSISEMLQRANRGLPINSGKPVFNGETLLPNWKSLDLIDRANIIAHTKNKIAVETAKRNEQIKAIDDKRRAYLAKVAADKAEAAAQQAEISKNEALAQQFLAQQTPRTKGAQRL